MKINNNKTIFESFIIYIYYIYIFELSFIKIFIGDWGLGIGDWGLGVGGSR